jgi:hypothetical protein
MERGRREDVTNVDCFGWDIKKHMRTVAQKKRLKNKQISI